MQYSTQTVLPLPPMLTRIGQVAVIHKYFPAEFFTACVPLNNLRSLKPTLVPKHNLSYAQFAALQWTTVTVRNGKRIVGFAATEQTQQSVKGCTIVWVFVVPEHRRLVEPALLQHLEQNDAYGCADLYFEAGLDIALWRRLLRNGYRPWTPRTYSRSNNGPVIAMDLLYESMQHLGGMFPPECLERMQNIQERKKTIDDAVALIRDESTTIEMFCERYSALIFAGSSSHIAFHKPLMPDNLYLPAGPTADTLPLFSF